MIRIIDKTLSCLDEFITDSFDENAVLKFLDFLIMAEVNAIEMSEKVYNLLSPLPPFPAYILRIDNAAGRAKYPGISRFVCRNADSADGVCTEIVLSDAHDTYTISRYASCARVRVQGMDGCLLGDYMQAYGYLQKAFYGELEFCPTNRLNCASALAAEWAINGFGDDIVTSFCGIGGYAPTEELIMILRLQRLRKVGKTYEFFPEMSKLFGEITGADIATNKPVIGENILHVESGVHVDGILKSPKCYEPFPPEVVGRARKIVLGKQSGSASIRAKLDEMGIKYKEEDIAVMLARVKALSAKKNAGVTEQELAEIVFDCMEEPQ